MRWLTPMMDADEPRFQIGEVEMDDRQIVLGNLCGRRLGMTAKCSYPRSAEAIHSRA